MRVLVAAVALATFAAQAEGARKPTPSERAGVTYAVVLAQVPDTQSSPAALLVRRVVVSTVEPGPGSNVVRFAAAFGVARDLSGYAAGARIAVVGLHPRTKAWIMVGYGPARAVCGEPQLFFGGRRAAILRDLGIRCP